MSNVDISKLSADQLADLQKQIETQMLRARADQKKQGLEKIKAIMDEYELSWDDLPGGRGGSKSPTAGRKVAPRYMNPNNPDDTWSGRGRKPRWLVAHLEAGGNIEECEIATA